MKQSALIRVIHNGQFLLLRRADSWETDKMCLPGGKQDSGEDIWQCASRELFEETAIRAGADMGNLDYLGKYASNHKGTDIEVHVFETYSDIPYKIVLNPKEHSTFAWVSLENIHNPPFELAGNTQIALDMENVFKSNSCA